MEQEIESGNGNVLIIPDYYGNPSSPSPSPSQFWFDNLNKAAHIISAAFLNLTSPFFALFSLAFPQPHSKRGHLEDEEEDSSFPEDQGGGGGGGLLVRKIGVGFVGAAYVCMLLMLVMLVAVIVGVGLVTLWVEEPVFVRETLHFDYTHAHPSALFSFGASHSESPAAAYYYTKSNNGIPVGHTSYVSVLLLMPESDYNREIGIFQVTAELLSSDGEVMVKSSRPCMLHFRSWPIRMMRTFLMGVPLLLGITDETQRINIPILKHKETAFPRTQHIRITLVSRAGTYALPQLYDAAILMNSQLPWRKELVYRWKWTFYIWTSLYIYIMLVIVLVCFSRPLLFPDMTAIFPNRVEDNLIAEWSRESEDKFPEESEISESLKRWQRSRNKRKAALLHHGITPAETPHPASLADSPSVVREEMKLSYDEGPADSESSDCFRGFD